jgi:hypothetical protein
VDDRHDGGPGLHYRIAQPNNPKHYGGAICKLQLQCAAGRLVVHEFDCFVMHGCARALRLLAAFGDSGEQLGSSRIDGKYNRRICESGTDEVECSSPRLCDVRAPIGWDIHGAEEETALNFGVAQRFPIRNLHAGVVQLLRRRRKQRRRERRWNRDGAAAARHTTRHL